MNEKVFEKTFDLPLEEVRTRLENKIRVLSSKDEVKQIAPVYYWNAKKNQLVLESRKYNVKATVLLDKNKATAFMEIPFLMSFFSAPFKKRFVRELSMAIK